MADSTSAHILVVDDEAEVRALLRTGLEREGFAVSEAKDGASLMAVLEKGNVDLITLDVRLSGEDGFSLAREVRAKQNAPIVMLTGMGDMTDRVVGSNSAPMTTLRSHSTCARCWPASGPSCGGTRP